MDAWPKISSFHSEHNGPDCREQDRRANQLFAATLLYDPGRGHTSDQFLFFGCFPALFLLVVAGALFDGGRAIKHGDDDFRRMAWGTGALFTYVQEPPAFYL